MCSGNCGKICGCAPRYEGVDIDCLGIKSGNTYEELVELFANSICDLNVALENVVGIDHIAFTTSTGSPSNVQGQPGEIDTYTFWADAAETVSIGTINVSNGVSGTNGIDGVDGSVILYKYLDIFLTGDPSIQATIDTPQMPNNGDTLEIQLNVTGLSSGGSTFYFKGLPGGGTPPLNNYASHVFDGVDDTVGKIEITLVRNGTNLSGSMKFIGKPDVYAVYPITISDFFTSSTYIFEFDIDGTVEDAQMTEVIIRRTRFV